MSDEIIKAKEDIEGFSKFVRFQLIIIGLLWFADTFFYFFEQNIFNTYVNSVLGLSDFWVSGVMVPLSAAVGLLMNFVWGILSDNTRSKYGRRRPYLLLSIFAGIGMILFALSQNYILCVIYDAVLIGVTANGVSVASRSLIPDVAGLEKRGRANGIVQFVSNVGLILGLVLFLLTRSSLDSDIISITLETHILLLTIGGCIYIACGIIGFLFIKEKPPSELPPKKKFTEELKELMDISLLKEQNNFFRVIGATTVYQTGIGSVMALLFIWILNDLPFGMLELMIAIAVGFLVLFPSVILIGKLADKYGRKKFFPPIILLIGIAFCLIPLAQFTENLILFIILTPFMLIGLLGLNTNMHTWAQDTLPEEKKGQFYGIFNITLTVPQIIGGIIGGIVSEVFGRYNIFILAGIFFLASIPFFLLVRETLDIDK